MFNFFKRIPSVSVRDLEEKLKGKVRLIDVRTPEEFKDGHIKEAKNFPLDKIENFDEGTDEEIYVICQSGMRSSRATKFLIQKGYKAFNVDGGMNMWTGKRVRG